MLRKLQAAAIDGHFEALDIELARAALKWSVVGDERLSAVVALLSRHTRNGHTCLPLNEVPMLLKISGVDISTDDFSALSMSALLESSELVRPKNPLAPFVFSNSQLFFQKHWASEESIASQILERSRLPTLPSPDESWFAKNIDQIFQLEPNEEQQNAVRAIVQNRFVAIVGGPGTGKTTTILSAAALFGSARLSAGLSVGNAMFLAPTGKAADRLNDAISTALPTIRCDSRVLAGIQPNASTIHRALRKPHLLTHASIVFVDETSMVDIEILARLFGLIGNTTSMVLVGDPNQLASVEAGAALSDIVDAANAVSSIKLVELQQAHRYGQSAIADFLEAIRSGDIDLILQQLNDKTSTSITLHKNVDELLPQYVESLDNTQMLCGLRLGRLGIAGLTAAVQAQIQELPTADQKLVPTPIVVTKNDPEVSIYNGERALVEIDADSGEKIAVFSQGQSSRRIHLQRISDWQHAYALSVHKSQGSEFDNVILVLPPLGSRLLTRELLYTGASRARHRLQIVSTDEQIKAAIQNRAHRDSGLVRKLSDAFSESTPKSSRI